MKADTAGLTSPIGQFMFAERLLYEPRTALDLHQERHNKDSKLGHQHITRQSVT